MDGFGFFLTGSFPLVSKERGGVQGKGKAGANSEGERESQALGHQRLAEVQTLGCQGGITFTHRSHFGMLLNQ